MENFLKYTQISNGDWQPQNTPNRTVLQSSSDKVVFDIVLFFIKSAKESICLQSFLIQDTAIIDELVKATERGVRVFVMSSAEARLKPTIEEEQDFITENYKKMLNEKFKFRFVHRSAENLHAKFIVIDGKMNPKGMIFTNNFTENGFFKNPEISVFLTTEQSKELYDIFVYYFWEKTTDEQTASNEFEKVKPLGIAELPDLKHILLSSDRSLKNTILRAIEKTQSNIILSTFTIDKDYEICKLIGEKQKESTLTIFTRSNERQLQDQIKDFIDNGAEIFLHQATHAKFILIDGKEGYVFTSNFNQNDFEIGFNIGIKLSAQQVDELAKIAEQWRKTMPQKWVAA
jgi:phosphatidylserine/phosphatidylglycerophosphate/cardiolipin synthase-like enzyme